MNNACSQLGCACIVSGSRGRSFSMIVGPAKVIPFGDTNVTSANKFQKMKDDLKRKTSVQTETTVLTVSHKIAPMGETIKKQAWIPSNATGPGLSKSKYSIISKITSKSLRLTFNDANVSI
ncbi:hypothetical protein V1477_016653 [Vespula maculifrons]|uniref:Uncharacterized protein n=1 Tax=Vespula maculifrons TaxID=7453 RepID=A0ABD2B3R3_VESMC